MQPGTMLNRIARLTCSSDRCHRILEPAIADLQHEWLAAESWNALLRNYAAFWQSWGTCVRLDVVAPESRSFSATAFTAFALIVAAAASIELVLMHTSVALRIRIVSIRSEVVSAAMFGTATLRYGVPLAVGPAMLYAARRRTRIAPAAYLTAAALGMFVTVLSSGWIAPTLIRYDITRQHEGYARWAAHAPSTSAQGWYVPPLDFSYIQTAKAWPELILSAAEPPRHQFALMPQYVGPGEEKRQGADRREITERLLLILLAFGSAVAGAAFGRATKGDVQVEAIDQRPC